MGIITSKDTRRISIDNTFAMSSARLIQKPNADTYDTTISFEKNTSCELDFNDSNSRFVRLPDEDYDDYWTHRIESLKNHHQEINHIIDKEYQKTIDNNNKLFLPPTITQEKIQKIKPCFDYRTKILQCYEDNSRQTLMCSAIVQAFSNCVSSCQLED